VVSSVLTASGLAIQTLPLIREIKASMANFEIKLAALSNDVAGIVGDIASGVKHEKEEIGRVGSCISGLKGEVKALKSTAVTV